MGGEIAVKTKRSLISIATNVLAMCWPVLRLRQACILACVVCLVRFKCTYFSINHRPFFFFFFKRLKKYF